jgi:signal transduction histidine kinase
MNRLFLKIFGWFWLTIMLVSAALIIVTMATIPQPPERPWNPELQSTRFLRQGLVRNLRDAVNLYESAGKENYLTRKSRSFLLREAFLFDRKGSEVTAMSPLPTKATEIVQALITSSRPDLYIHPFIGIRIISASQEKYYCVLRTTQLARARGQLGFFTRVQVSAYDNLTKEMIFGLLSVFLIAGILCFFLARYLTTPISRLRRATRELSEGNLSTRIGPSMGRRNDEIAYLAHDFDQMAEQIEKLLKSQIRLIRDISHELRSPLARLNVALELARLSPEDGRMPALDRIETESHCLNNLIEQLLTLSRMESGTLDSKKNIFELGSILRGIAEDATFESKPRNIEVQVIQKEEINITGFEQILHSALENVVRNALVYTKDNTTIRILLESEPVHGTRNAKIEVRDQGEGVLETELDKIFTPFYRIAPSRDRNSGGSGIGLAITERAVKIHNGSINAANHPEGGLIITIMLPLE